MSAEKITLVFSYKTDDETKTPQIYKTAEGEACGFIIKAVDILEQGQKGGNFTSPLVRESIVQLGLVRKLPLPGGKRGAKAAPIPALGVWCQVVRVTDPRYQEVQQMSSRRRRSSQGGPPEWYFRSQNAKRLHCAH